MRLHPLQDPLGVELGHSDQMTTEHLGGKRWQNATAKPAQCDGITISPLGRQKRSQVPVKDSGFMS